MTLTNDYLDKIRDVAKAYDAETIDLDRRVLLGQEFDRLTDKLSDGQLKQVTKILRRIY